MCYSTDFLVCINIAPRNNDCGAREFLKLLPWIFHEIWHILETLLWDRAFFSHELCWFLVIQRAVHRDTSLKQSLKGYSCVCMVCRNVGHVTRLQSTARDGVGSEFMSIVESGSNHSSLWHRTWTRHLSLRPKHRYLSVCLSASVSLFVSPPVCLFLSLFVSLSASVSLSVAAIDMSAICC